jgi:hypothetical protein
VAVVLPGSFIYLATVGTASSAVTTVLKGLPGAFQPKDPHAGVGRHATLAQIRACCATQLTGSEVVFAAVRNPYDLIVSWYLRNRSHFQVPPDASLVEFLQVWLELDPEPFLRDHRMFFLAMSARHVMRYERGVERELNSLLRKLPRLPEVAVPQENVTLGKAHWSTYYDREAYAFVNEMFARDISQFGYCFVRG